MTIPSCRTLFPFRAAVLAVALATVAGCGPRAPTLQAASQRAFAASAEVLAKAGPRAERAPFAQALATFNAAYFPSPGHPPRSDAPDWRVVQGMTQAQFIHFVNRTLAAPPRPAPPVEEPDGYVTNAYLSTLDLDLELLRLTQDAAHAKNRFTSEQFRWGRPDFIAPFNDGLLQDDPARFVVRLANDSPFDAYSPTFEVVIRDPETRVELFRRELVPAKDTVALAMSVTDITYTCCTLSKDSLNNALLAHLREDAIFEYHLTSVKDSGRVDALDRTIFPATSYARLLRVTDCLKDTRAKQAHWLPSQSAQSCTDPTIKIARDEPVPDTDDAFLNTLGTGTITDGGP